MSRFTLDRYGTEAGALGDPGAAAVYRLANVLTTRGGSATREYAEHFEGAWSRGASMRSNRNPEGIWVPPALFGIGVRDFNAGSATEAGALKGKAVVGPADALLPASALELAGATVMEASNDTMHTRLSVSPVIGVATEVAALQEQTPNTDAKLVTPCRIGAFVEVSRRALVENAVATTQAVQGALRRAIAAQLDWYAINGSGSGGQPTGLRTASGVQSVVAGNPDGATLTHALLADMEDAVGGANAEPGTAAAFLVNSATRKWLRKKPKGSADMTWDDAAVRGPLLGYRAIASSNLPANLTKGAGSNLSAVAFASDWSLACIYIFGGGVDLTVDAVTRADQGQVKVTAELYFDFVLSQPGAFAVCNDAKLA